MHLHPSCSSSCTSWSFCTHPTSHAGPSPEAGWRCCRRYEAVWAGGILKKFHEWFINLVNMPDPIRIRSGSAGMHWPEAGRMVLAQWLASGPDPFGQNLTQPARTKPDPGWFCTILSQYYPGHLWNNGTESQSGKLVAGQLRPARNRARWFLHTGLRPDAFSQTLTRPSRWDPGRFCTKWSTLSLAKRGSDGCGKSDPACTIRPDSGCTMAVMAVTGRN